MNPLERLDRWLLDDVAQPFSDWTTDRFGRNCFWLARAAAIASNVSFLLPDLWRAPIAAAGLFILFAAINHGEESTKRAPRCRNAMAAWPIPRLVMGVMTMGILASETIVIIHAGAVSIDPLSVIGTHTLFVAAAYFLSCTPRPPRPREVKLPANIALEPV